MHGIHGPALPRTSLMAALLACLMVWLGQPSSPAADKAVEDPLLEINKTFRKVYAASRKELLARADPLILVEGDDLVLLHQGKRLTATVIPETYHTLKTVAHVPLALYVLLLPTREGPLPEHVVTALMEYRQQLLAAAKGLDGRGLASHAVARSRQVLGDCLGLVDRVATARQLQPGELAAFARKQAPSLLWLAAAAARIQLDALHRQVSEWKAALTPDEWRRLRVIVMASQMPRKGHLSVQYFARLLGEPGEGPRIVYAEGLGDEGRALQLLGTHLIDTQAGTDFFGDPRRLHRDMLSDGAAEYLEQLDFEAKRR